MMLSNAKIKMILKSTTAMAMISILDRRPEIVSDRLVYSPPCEIKQKNGGKIQIYVIKKEVNPTAALSSIDDLLF